MTLLWINEHCGINFFRRERYPITAYAYADAESDAYGNADTDDLEAAEEFYPECPNGEDYKYDNKNGRYSNT